jgi:hypothetical protein
MGKKGLSLEDKRQKILELYYERVRTTCHHTLNKLTALKCRKRSST